MSTPASRLNTPKCNALAMQKRTNVPHPPQRPMPPWTSRTNWIHVQTTNQYTMPAVQPSRKRHSARGSRASATSTGVRAKGVSQTKLKGGKSRIRKAADIAASAKLSGSLRGLFIHQIRHVGAADERAAEYHLESDGKPIIAVGVELRGGHVSGYRQVPPRPLQGLADGPDVHLCSFE